MSIFTEALSVFIDVFKNFHMLPPFHQNFEFLVYVIWFKSSKIRVNMQWNTVLEATVERSAVKNSFIAYVCYDLDDLFWLNLYLDSSERNHTNFHYQVPKFIFTGAEQGRGWMIFMPPKICHILISLYYCSCFNQFYLKILFCSLYNTFTIKKSYPVC